MRGLNPVEDVEIDTVNMAGFLEIDGIFWGLHQELYRDALSHREECSSPWNGHLWDHVTLGGRAAYCHSTSMVVLIHLHHTRLLLHSAPGGPGLWNFKATWLGNTPTLP